MAQVNPGVSIIADTRENAVHPFLGFALQGNKRSRSEHLSRDIPWVVRQITVGDFILTENGTGPDATVLAVIERKTHADFAASLGDGRHGNKEKMLEMRGSTGCDVYYIMEGPAFPVPTRRFGRVPWSTIQAAALSLMVRDGIFVAQTPSSRGTAELLDSLARSYVKHGEAGPARPEPAPLVAGGAGLGDAMEDATGPDPKDAPPEVHAMMGWAAVRGISDSMGAALVRQVSVVALARMDPKDMRELRTPQNKRLAKSPNVLKSVRALACSPPLAAKFIGGIPGLSKGGGERILSSFGGSLARLCEVDAAVLARCPYGDAGQVGRARATRLVAALNAGGGGGPGASDPADLPRAPPVPAVLPCAPPVPAYVLPTRPRAVSSPAAQHGIALIAHYSPSSLCPS